jgi:hypothetical protein
MGSLFFWDVVLIHWTLGAWCFKRVWQPHFQDYFCLYLHICKTNSVNVTIGLFSLNPPPFGFLKTVPSSFWVKINVYICHIKMTTNDAFLCSSFWLTSTSPKGIPFPKINTCKWPNWATLYCYIIMVLTNLYIFKNRTCNHHVYPKWFYKFE